MKPLTPKQVYSFVETAIKCGEVPYISGPPGIGKSDIMAQVADDWGLKLVDIRLSQMLPEDLTGLPQVDTKTGKATYLPFNTFPLEGDDLPIDPTDGSTYNGWLVFTDELSSTTDETLAAVYNLFLGRMVGGKKLHEKAILVSAGNRASDSAIARPLPDTILTRILPVEMKANSKDWVKWAKANNCNSVVIDFIDKNPDMLLSTIDFSKREELETYATPRGWGKVSNIVNYHENKVKKSGEPVGLKDSAGLPTGSMEIPNKPLNYATVFLITAAVGTIAAQSFKEVYNEALTIPEVWDVAQSPSSCVIPGTLIGKATLTNKLGDYYMGSDEQVRDKILQYMNRMDSEHRALFSQTIKDELGSSPSDNALIKSINKRLNITGIKGDVEDIFGEQ